jgi:hypothetical protein
VEQWLKALSERIAAANPRSRAFAPTDKVQRGDKVIGVLPPDLRKLYVAVRKSLQSLMEAPGSDKEITDRLSRLVEGVSREEDFASAEKSLLAHSEHELLCHIFWHGVRRVFPDKFMFTPFGFIRTGWRVVTVKRETSRMEAQFMGITPD